MILGRIRHLALLLLLLLLPQFLTALTVKLASPLPEGTEWDNALRRMADEWSEITGGHVRVKIYPGGIAGDEADMVRKMRIGQIDAGVFTAFGLKMMVPETFVLTLPGLLKNDAELDFVLDNYVQRFDNRFREEGFEILDWSRSGWAFVFSRTAIHTPGELRRGSLVLNNTESDVIAAYKAMGFQVVPADFNETMVVLQSGMANIFTAPPIAAAAFQWFALAPYMTEFPIAPVIGGMVISQRSWQRIPDEYHDELKASMKRVALKFYTESLKLNDEALRVMIDNGLQLISLSEDENEAFEQMMKSGHSQMVGDDKAVPPEQYEELQNELEAFRKR